MKTKKSILRYFKYALIINLFFLSNISHASESINYSDYNDITRYFNSEISKLLKNYSHSKMLQADILDLSNQSVKRFLNNTLKKDVSHLLAVQYFPEFEYNEIKTSFCFIFYNSKNNIFQQYEASKHMTKTEILKYLVWHEMGHCFSFHENFIKDSKTDEFIADAFAVFVATNHGDLALANKIIKQINSLDENDIHANGKKIEQFLIEIISKNLHNDKKTINQILNIIQEYHNKH